jgi:hypothetical protein
MISGVMTMAGIHRLPLSYFLSIMHHISFPGRYSHIGSHLELSWTQALSRDKKAMMTTDRESFARLRGVK